jgi:hypothetical protein
VLPDLFVDRSLGGVAVPDFFREVWPAEVRYLDEVFGKGPVEDTTWMSRCDEEGWVAACKDGRIRRRRGERQLMSHGTLRVFCLANGNRLRDVQVSRFRDNLGDILEQAPEPGPWLYAVYADHIENMTLYN